MRVPCHCVRIAGWLDKFGSILETAPKAGEVFARSPPAQVMKWLEWEQRVRPRPRALSDGRHFPSQGPPGWSDMKHATPGNGA
jgi:hypothetical protein